MPSVDPSTMSTHSSDPSVIGETPEQAYGAHRRVESKPEPEHERLLECRARVAKAKARLDAIEDEYRHGLAATLVTYDEVEKSQYDRLYTKKHNGRSFEAVQAGAQAALTRAEAEHDVAWREAEAAGVTDLPLSPIDLGGKYTQDCSEVVLQVDCVYESLLIFL